MPNKVQHIQSGSHGIHVMYIRYIYLDEWLRLMVFM